jgi:hypothetical protein
MQKQVENEAKMRDYQQSMNEQQVQPQSNQASGQTKVFIHNQLLSRLNNFVSST